MDTISAEVIGTLLMAPEGSFFGDFELMKKLPIMGMRNGDKSYSLAIRSLTTDELFVTDEVWIYGNGGIDPRPSTYMYPAEEYDAYWEDDGVWYSAT